MPLIVYNRNNVLEPCFYERHTVFSNTTLNQPTTFSIQSWVSNTKAGDPTLNYDFHIFDVANVDDMMRGNAKPVTLCARATQLSCTSLFSSASLVPTETRRARPLCLQKDVRWVILAPLVGPQRGGWSRAGLPTTVEHTYSCYHARTHATRNVSIDQMRSLLQLLRASTENFDVEWHNNGEHISFTTLT